MSIDKYQKNNDNPFVTTELLLDLHDKNVKVGTKRLDTNTQLIDKVTGEVKPMFSYTYTKQIIDSKKFTKMYTDNLGMIFGLSKGAQLVLRYICDSLIPKADYVFINIEKCREYCEYKTRQSVYNSLEDLLKAEIIARTDDTYRYWINPSVLFNGDRMIFINEFIRKQEDLQTIELENQHKQLSQEFKDSNLNS